MAQRIFSFDNPERFVAGTVGQPGHRVFYLQAKDGPRIVSVVLEKTQVAVLAERLAQLLAEVRERGAAIPELPSADEEDSAPLDEPLNEEFQVGQMAIVWDGEVGAVVIEARALSEADLHEVEGEEEESFEVEEEDDSEADIMRVQIKPSRALAFAKRAIELVAAGRPPCPFCGQPLNPEGHICVRRNGYMH
jgi:uncharacterized repeat protein (TIGR03847 family)